MCTGYLHKLDPFAVRIADDFGIRWYGLSYLAGFLAAWLLIRWLSRRGLTQLKPEEAGDFIFAAAVGTITGGRLGYCLFYSPELLFDFSKAPPFWGVLAVWKGGMASHGGLIGIICGCIYFARTRRISILHCMDLAALGSGPGIFFGRIANFINGELIGREAPSWLWWGVRFPQDILNWPHYEPQRLSTLVPVVSHLGISQDKWTSAVDACLSSGGSRAFVHSVLERIVAAVQHSNFVVADSLAPLLTLRHPSQLYEALLEGLFLFLVLMYVWRKARKPGVVSGMFLVVYPVVRIICEAYRMPDIQIGFQWLGFTRGQWLSIVTILFGLVCLYYWSRRDAVKIGGWGGACPSPHDDSTLI